jgi:hypothetical protein
MKMQKRSVLGLGLGLLVGGAAFAQTRTAIRLDPFVPEATTTGTITVSGPAEPVISRPPVRTPFRPPARSPFRL